MEPVNANWDFFKKVYCISVKERSDRRRQAKEDLDPSVLNRVCSALQERPGWNALFLGCITSGIRSTGMPGLSEIDYRCPAHAYVLNTPFARRITGKKLEGVPIDDLLRRKCTNFFAFSPMCAFQGLAGSDNQTVTINRLRTIFGGLSFIQSANKLYQGHKVAIVAAHPVLAGPSSFWSVAPGRVPR